MFIAGVILSKTLTKKYTENETWQLQIKLGFKNIRKSFV